jgi:signal transduction histidine kinase
VTLRARVTIAVVAVVAVGVVALAVSLYAAVRRELWAQHDRGLAGRARALAALVEYDEAYEFEAAGAEAAGLARAYYQVWTPDGAVLAQSPSLGGVDLPQPEGAEVFADVMLPDGTPGRLVAIHVRAFADTADEGDAGLVTIVLAEGTHDVRATLATIRRAAWLLGGGTLLAIALLAAFVVARALRPLPRLGRAIEAIDDRKLTMRLPVDDQPAELQGPVRKLNDLLARLDASFARERRFTADVSHELRTPLAGLRTLLEVTALRDRSGDDYRRALADAGAIVVQLAALVDNLLLLARLDAGQLPVAREPVALRALVDACWAPHAALASKRGLAFRNTIDADARLTTDREKLRVVIANLLGNAAEYTEAGGWIEVTGGGAAVLDVIDSGPPIPAEHLEHLFDRMWRAEAARSGGGVHVGIGLSLARSLCDALHCTLTATTLDDGSVRFRVASADPLMVPSSTATTVAA